MNPVEYLLTTLLMLGLTFGGLVLWEIHLYLRLRKERERHLEEHRNRMTRLSEKPYLESGTDGAN